MTATPDVQATAEELARWLDRERRARQEAEAIAERTTGELYAATQELAKANRALLTFLAMTSHDLRTPLLGIIGSVGLLHRDDLAADQQRQVVETIERCANRLDRLVEDLLAISRIESGKLAPRPRSVPLLAAIGSALESLPPDLRHGVTIDGTAAVVAVVDPDHLQRILTNYLVNAHNHGAPPVEVSAWIDDDGDVVVAVRDHGDGVPADFADQLFGHFARSPHTAGDIAGTGLGLAIVRGLAEANGGAAWYERAADGGACFLVRLPVASG